jgi:hypothetical protein
MPAVPRCRRFAAHRPIDNDPAVPVGPSGRRLTPCR